LSPLGGRSRGLRGNGKIALDQFWLCREYVALAGIEHVTLEGEALTRKAIELVKAGDMQSLSVRIGWPRPRKDSPVAFDLPEGEAEAALHGNLAAAVRSRRLARICLDTCEAGKAAAEAGWLGGFL
jgi:hypothetical protein